MESDAQREQRSPNSKTDHRKRQRKRAFGKELPDYHAPAAMFAASTSLSAISDRWFRSKSSIVVSEPGGANRVPLRTVRVSQFRSRV